MGHSWLETVATNEWMRSVATRKGRRWRDGDATRRTFVGKVFEVDKGLRWSLSRPECSSHPSTLSAFDLPTLCLFRPGGSAATVTDHCSAFGHIASAWVCG